jgi:hypothetical protein
MCGGRLRGGAQLGRGHRDGRWAWGRERGAGDSNDSYRHRCKPGRGSSRQSILVSSGLLDNSSLKGSKATHGHPLIGTVVSPQLGGHADF